jgi:hypothetical protein
MDTPVPNPKPSRIRRWLILLGVSMVLCAMAYPFAKHTLPGEIIRSTFRDVPPAQLWADDLATDVRTKNRLAPLQNWSVRTLARYQAGQLATTGRATFAGQFSARLDPKEIPSWLHWAWWGDHPEVSVSLNMSNQPQCIVVGWYLCGLLVGPTNYVTAWQPWYIVKVKPGIYAYSLEK